MMLGGLLRLQKLRRVAAHRRRAAGAPKKACRSLSDGVARIDLVPSGFELSESGNCGPDSICIDCRFAFQAAKRGGAFDFGSPPHEHCRILGGQGQQMPRRDFGNQQRHDSRSIPELHRPARRSSRSASTAEAPAVGRGGNSVNNPRGMAARPGRTMPSRIRRDSRSSGSGPRPLVTGSRRATGRPRSTIRTGDPLLRPSISALSLFLASVILAFFIKLK